MPVSLVGFGRIADGSSVLSSSATSDLVKPRVCAVNSTNWLPVLALSAPHTDRTLLILRGRRMDPACWQPEKGCPAVGLTWVCWH
ncbi:hypothetical protein V8C34DRAFT_278915, partial [Trichoderma compactum]